MEDNLIYEGNFQKGQKSGFGILYSQDKSYKYSGNFAKNEKNGKGRIIFIK